MAAANGRPRLPLKGAIKAETSVGPTRRITAAKAVRQLDRRLAKATRSKSCATGRGSVFRKPLNWKCLVNLKRLGEKPHQELAAACAAQKSAVRYAALRFFGIPT
jgi:hypothetical protein